MSEELSQKLRAAATEGGYRVPPELLMEAAALLERQRERVSELEEALKSGGGEVRAIFDDWRMTTSGCPVQLEGRDRLTGRPLYYRDRWGSWRLEFSDDAGEVIARGASPYPDDDVQAIGVELARFGVRFGTMAPVEASQ